MRRLGTFLIFAALLRDVSAQVPVPERGPAERPPLPGFRGAQEPAPRFVLPPAPSVPDESIRGSLRIVITAFRITGATAFPESELQALLAPYTKRPIGSQELEEARLAITRHYVAAGYINSGAVIPDQDLRGGVVEIRVVEGRLAGIDVEGDRHFRDAFIRDRVALDAGPPLNVNRLQERMQLLLQNPQVERINAELAPGVRPGEARLRMDVKEAPRYTVGAAVANNRSPTVGGTRAEVSFAARDQLGLGDAFGARIGLSEGLEDETLTFALPVSARETIVSAKLERVRAQVVEPPFDLIDIRNRSSAWEVGLSHPFVRTLTTEGTLGATLARRDNASFLLGQPFAFIPGNTTGETVVSALRLIGDWNRRTADSVLAARLTLSCGLSAMGSTVSTTGDPDSRFVSRLAQVQYAHRLPGEAGQLIVRFDWQRANGALLPSEKFAVGGFQSVRGYRENALVRDFGTVASIEYRRPIGRLALPGAGNGADAGTVEAAVFLDTGRSRDDGQDATSISSFGAGLRWTPAPGALALIYKGFPRQSLDTPHRDLQDHGVHFFLGMQHNF